MTPDHATGLDDSDDERGQLHVSLNKMPPIADAPTQAKAPADLKIVADFLRSGSAGLKVRVWALNGKRVDYFKGKSAVKTLLSPAYQRKVGMPAVSNEAEAMTVLHAVHTFAFYIRVQRFGPSDSSSSSPKMLQIMPEQNVSRPTTSFPAFRPGLSSWDLAIASPLALAIAKQYRRLSTGHLKRFFRVSVQDALRRVEGRSFPDQNAQLDWTSFTSTRGYVRHLGFNSCQHHFHVASKGGKSTAGKTY
ncbi:hypothetical protein BDZ89DRAFT_1137066 [Hymenopellis radicata]|nr:hypothetical protein BDZ89DRAFT_1137066 [Hymenopellis radicata]